MNHRTMSNAERVTDGPGGRGELERALRMLTDEVTDGLKHGFFQCSVRCELGRGRRRELTIEAGKSHRFVIAAVEVEGQSDRRLEDMPTRN